MSPSQVRSQPPLAFLTQLPLTEKGRVTRRRIVEAAADLMVERGVSAVSLDEVGRATSTSKSQMYHYFTSKDDLVAAVVICVQDRILAFHGELLVAVESVDDLRGWADSIVAFHRAEPRWSGCPLGSLSSELMSVTETGRLELQEAFGSWQLLLTHTLARLQDSGKLRADAEPERLATATLASLEGGLLMSKALQEETPLTIALDVALGFLGTYAVT
jgi:AcrR family transcriptional regulator